MQTSLMLFTIIVAGSVLIQLAFLVLYHWRNTWRYKKQVVATIQQIQIWLDGWYVAATWTDAFTGQSYTFYSLRIESGLVQQVGESIIVDVDPGNFKLSLNTHRIRRNTYGLAKYV
jgi:hypothetical protein